MGRNKHIICNICNRTVRKDSLPRHLRTHGMKTKEGEGIRNRNNFNPCDLMDNNMLMQVYPSYQNRFEKFDIRLKENFKLFISGPSRCGKHFLCQTLLKILKHFLNNLLQLLSMSTKFGKQNLMR